jgi:hypothetical protein
MIAHRALCEDKSLERLCINSSWLCGSLRNDEKRNGQLGIVQRPRSINEMNPLIVPPMSYFFFFIFVDSVRETSERRLRLASEQTAKP